MTLTLIFRGCKSEFLQYLLEVFFLVEVDSPVLTISSDSNPKDLINLP
jgi:hypothetical protein